MDDAVFGSSVQSSHGRVLALVAWMTPFSGHPCSQAMVEGFLRGGMDDAVFGSSVQSSHGRGFPQGWHGWREVSQRIRACTEKTVYSPDWSEHRSFEVVQQARVVRCPSRM